MKIRKTHALIFLLLGLFAFTISCGESEEEKKLKMKEFVEKKCTMCHFSKRIFEKARTPDEWGTIVNRMRSKNPTHISSDEAQEIMTYLEETMSKDEEED